VSGDASSRGLFLSGTSGFNNLYTSPCTNRFPVLCTNPPRHRIEHHSPHNSDTKPFHVL
jgi:hypothetical protein